MRRRLIGLLTLALLAAACTAGGGDDSTPAASIDPNAQHDPLTLTVWSNFSGREFDVETIIVSGALSRGPSLTSSCTTYDPETSGTNCVVIPNIALRVA